MFAAKSITRDMSGGLYIANELTIHADAVYFDKVAVNVMGSKDVYYLNMRNGNMYVFRNKLRNQVNGCLFVRDRDEYTAIYNMIATQQYSGMPENMFVALDRKWESNLQEGMNG